MLERSAYKLLGNGVVKYDGLRWRPVRLKKPALCAITGKALAAGEEAFRADGVNIKGRRDRRIAIEVFRG